MEDIRNSRAQFHALTEGTRDDWQLIGGELERFVKKLPDRLIAHLELLQGDYGGFPIDRLEHCLQTATRAHQAGQCDGVPSVGCDPIPGLCGDHGGRDDPADRAFVGERAGEPGATRPSVIDKDKGWAFGLQPAEKCIAIALPRPAVPKGDDLGVRFLGDVRDGNGRLMNISPDGECARLVHG